jgi:hypothetical protein
MQARQRFWPSAVQRVGVIALALALACPLRANADAFSFTATDAGSGTFAYGLFEATNNGNGSYTATSGFLVIVSGPDVGTYDLFPNPNPPNPFASPDGVFSADDLLYPGQNPTLDVFGPLFTGGGLEINIWNNGGGVPYSFYIWNGNTFTFDLGSNNAAFSLASTPADQVGVLQSVVTELVNIGVMLPANGNPLQAKLKAALDDVNKGNNDAAIGSLNAFSNQVDAFIQNGTLTADEGQPMIDLASAIITALGG